MSTETDPIIENKPSKRIVFICCGEYDLLKIRSLLDKAFNSVNLLSKARLKNRKREKNNSQLEISIPVQSEPAYILIVYKMARIAMSKPIIFLKKSE